MTHEDFIRWFTRSGAGYPHRVQSGHAGGIGNYLSLLRQSRGGQTLLALVDVQSHQFQRALDLAAYARRNECLAVIGGLHVMTCDTSMLHGRGVSFALAEAELVWRKILEDAAGGELRPVYGADGRWQQDQEAPIVVPHLFPR